MESILILAIIAVVGLGALIVWGGGIAVVVRLLSGPRKELLPGASPAGRMTRRVLGVKGVRTDVWLLRQLTLGPEEALMDPDLQLGKPHLDRALFIMAPAGLRARTKRILQQDSVEPLLNEFAKKRARVRDGWLSGRVPLDVLDDWAEALEDAFEAPWRQLAADLGLTVGERDREGLRALSGTLEGFKVRLEQAADTVVLVAVPGLPEGLEVVHADAALPSNVRLQNPILPMLVKARARDAEGAELLLAREEVVEPLLAVIHARPESALRDGTLVVRGKDAAAMLADALALARVLCPR